MFKKPIALIASVALAACLCPAAALADEGSADLAAGSALSTQASTKTVWVITKVSWSNMGWNLPTTYKYDKNGLISKRTTRHKQLTNGGKSVTLSNVGSNKYNADGKLTKTVYTSTGESKKPFDTYEYGDNGAIARRVFNDVYNSKENATTYTSNTSGQVTKVADEYAASGGSNGDGHDYSWYRSFKLTYDKSGRISKAKQLQTTYRDGKKWKSNETYKTYTFSYDKKGNVTKAKCSGTSSYKATYKNTYKSGRLVKRTLSGTGVTFPNTFTYTYKKLTVPAKYAKLVAEQQRELLNPTPTNIEGWEYI